MNNNLLFGEDFVTQCNTVYDDKLLALKISYSYT